MTRYKRLRFTLPAVITSAVVLGLVAQSTPASAASPISFGSTIQLQPGEQWSAGIARIEKIDGRLDTVRIFQNAPQPSIFQPLGTRSGIISFREAPADVLAGTYDAQFRAFFAATPTTHTTWWSYYHEADVAYTHGKLPDLQQFRDAYTHIAVLARAAANPNLKLAVILVGYTANPRSGLTVSEFMPAAGYADVIAWDNYNGWSQRNSLGYGDPTNMLKLDKTAAAGVGLPFAVAEFGSTVGGPTGSPDYQGRANWITSFAQIADTTGALFADYYDYGKVGSPSSYRLDDVPAQTAYHNVVSDQNPFN